MALHKVAVAAKDGAGSSIAGGIQQHDTSGTGAGPNHPLMVNVDSAGNEVLGLTTDAAATQTDTTAVSHTSLFKQISKTLQAMVASAAGALFSKITDGTNSLTLMAASSGAPAATVVAVPVTLRDMLPPGSAVSASSAPVVVASDQATQAVAFDTSQLLNGKSGVGLTPSKVKISISTATTTTLVALVAGKKIRVLSMYLVCAAADTVTLQSHTTTSNSDGGCSYAANGGMSLPFNPVGWFDTTAGEALDMVTSAAGQVSGQLTYIAV